jgi:hypothetical protein
MAKKGRVYDDRTGKEPLIDYIRNEEGVSNDSNAKSSSSNTSSSGSNSGSSGNHSFYNTGAANGIKRTGSNTSANSDVSDEKEVIDGSGGGKGDRGERKQRAGSFYNPTKKGKKHKLLAKLKKNKSVVGLVAGGSAGLVPILIIIFLFIASQLIPNVGQIILDTQFARVNRQFIENNKMIDSEDVALNSIEDEAENTAVQNSFKDTTDGLITKFNSLTPNGVLRNLNNTGDMTYNTTPSRFTKRPIVRSITIGDETIDVQPTGIKASFNKLFHPIDTFKGQVADAQRFSAGVKSSLDDSTGIIIRGAVENALRGKLGVGLSAYIASKFLNKDPVDSDLVLATEAQNTISPPTVPPQSLVKAEDTADAEGEAQLQSDLQNPVALKNIVENTDGVDTAANTAENSTINSALGGILAKTSIAYAIALPVCLIYDGSLVSPNAGQNIDTQDDQIQRSFYYLESAADQQKDGTNVNAEAVGAMNRKVGNFAQSNPYLRSSGLPVDSGSTFTSPQAGAGGQYSILNSLFPSAIAGFLNSWAPRLCGFLTNPVTAVAFLLVQAFIEALIAIPTDGAGAAGATSGADALVAALDGTADGVASSLTTDTISQVVNGTIKNFSGKLGEMITGVFSKQGIKQIVGITGLTMLAKMEVLKSTAETYNGLSEGTDWVNQADAGGNLNANETCRIEFDCAPLSNDQVVYNNAQDNQYLAEQNNSKSIFQRYFATGNAFSLVSRVGMTVDSDFTKNNISKMFSSIVSDLNPAKFGSSILSLFSKVTPAHAAVAPADVADIQDYGIVQYGYTAQEQALVDPTTGPTANTASYQPLENQQILSKSGMEPYIKSVYGTCFSLGTSMGTLLTKAPPDKFGTFMNPDPGQPAWIIRSTNGNVIGGLCSQDYVGPFSLDKMAYDKVTGIRDLVFRYRLAQGYNNSIDQLISIQNAKTTQDN